MTQPILEVFNLVKSYDGFAVLKGISFQLHKGEILGFLGPNGAGKTTTVHTILGVTSPDSGTIKIFGSDLKKNREKILSNLNFSSAYVSLPEKLTVWENLTIFATLFDVKTAKFKIEKLLETFGVTELKDKPYWELSAGQRTRVNFAKSLLNDPQILLLDEPMASLDPEAADRARNLLKNIQKQRQISILYTSHNMGEVEKLCSRVIFLHKGEIVASGSPLEVTKQVLKGHTEEPDLEKVFITLARQEPHET